MYERFTDRARKVMQLANQEAQRFNHEYIGTEHILFALLKEGSGVAASVLKNLDLDLRQIQSEIEKLVAIVPGGDQVVLAKLPHTPRTKAAIEFAMDEARGLNHNYVGTEHLLLGLLRVPDGTAGKVLVNLGLEAGDVREEVMSLLGMSAPEQPPAQFKRRTETATEAEVMQAARTFSEASAKVAATRVAVEQAYKAFSDAQEAFKKAHGEFVAAHAALSDLSAGPIANSATTQADLPVKRGYEFL